MKNINQGRGQNNNQKKNPKKSLDKKRIKTMTSLSVVILNFNAGKYLKKTIQSLKKAYHEDKKQKSSYQIVKVVVVDNASNDNSADFLKKESDWGFEIKLIETSRNLGFSGGNNVGAEEAVIDKPDLVLFLNPDTLVLPQALAQTTSFLASRSQVGAVTAKLVLEGGQADEASHRGFPTPWRAFCYFTGLRSAFPKSRLFAGYSLGNKLDNPEPHEIDACSGAFLMVKTSLGQKLGWWDEDYFLYGEDLDFCYRIKSVGKKIYFLPQAKIIHYWGISSGIKKHSASVSRATKETRLTSSKASIEAMRIFYRKHFFGKYPLALRWLVQGGISLLEKYRLAKIQKQYK